jgi:uncharacterized protein (TIGR02569 family)
VCAAWKVRNPVRLPGGQGTAYSAGDLVLKPVLDELEAVWLAEVLADLPERDDVRIIRPVPSTSGQWVVGGWAAWERLEGAPRRGAWSHALEISRRFHAAVADVPWSEALTASHPWAIGHRYAWGEQDLDLPQRLRALAARLRRRLRTLELPSQLVHGDLINNVLFHRHLPPAVIDISPCWRPVRYSEAIIIVDAIGWNDAERAAGDALSDPDGMQLLIRAMLFRLGSAVVLCDGNPGRLDAELDTYERIESALIS